MTKELNALKMQAGDSLHSEKKKKKEEELKNLAVCNGIPPVRIFNAFVKLML